jgi:hypothetical protein
MIDKGSGTAVVFISGIQGRWEWISEAIDSLSKRYLASTATDRFCNIVGSFVEIQNTGGRD